MAEIQHIGRSLPEVPLLSQMTQESVHPGNGDPRNVAVPDSEAEVGERRRPWSSQGIKSTLSPSPAFLESKRHAKDDNDVEASPVTPKRPAFGSRLGQGLSLQMPPRDVSSTSTANLTTKRIPISPKPDPTATFTSPTSVLPRRSRGMDYSRAATNLHHSTLAEQSSPESSPTVGGRRGMAIPPPRKSLFGTPNGFIYPESPSVAASSSSWANVTATTERSGLSSSVPSSGIMDDESRTSSSDEDEVMDYGEDEDTIHGTPQANGIGLINPWPALASSPSGDGVGNFSAHAAKLLSYQRHRVQNRRSRARQNSNGAGGQSSLQSPGASSPPSLRPSESSMSISGAFLIEEPAKKSIESRRESLSLGTNDLHLSDAEQSDDSNLPQILTHEDPRHPMPRTPGMEERKEVVRRAVTRRGNLLPKSKSFARIRAELSEECAPIDSEVRKEAEVIRQVRENDADNDIAVQMSQPTTSNSSPKLVPTTTNSSIVTGSLNDASTMDSAESSRRNSASAFSSQAIRNSGGISFWNNFDERMRTPPPIIVPRSSSSGASDEMSAGTPQSSIMSTTPLANGVKNEESAAPLAQPMPVPLKGTKRMRDDDFDPNYFKRRAVSPGLSVQNSPVLPQSPGWWGTQSKNNNANGTAERTSSNGSTASVNGGCGPKRVGLQGMNDTNDGLMNMSIE